MSEKYTPTNGGPVDMSQVALGPRYSSEDMHRDMGAQAGAGIVYTDTVQHNVTHTNLPATDARRRVRIWDKEWNCLSDERAQPSELPTKLIERALRRLDITEANVTLDDTDGSRRSGYASLNPSGVQIIDHNDVKRFTQWPDL